MSGDTATLAAITESTSITGAPEAIIILDSPHGQAQYRTDISPDSLARRKSLALPYAVELSTLEAVGRRMTGQTYYVMTPLWTSLSGESIRGRKYVAAEVTGVEPGSGITPLKIVLRLAAPDGDGQTFTLNMAAPGRDTGSSTRSFSNLFSLTDPRLKYPKIADDTWAHIQAGEVVGGMTRDECRLALGTPSEVDRRAGYSDLYEIWTYSDGRRLIFTDGLLTSLNR